MLLLSRMNSSIPRPAVPSPKPTSAQRLRRIDEVMEIAGATYMKDRYVESLSAYARQFLERKLKKKSLGCPV